jgi:F-type H+-transporting ATPase subunit epsilon
MMTATMLLEVLTPDRKVLSASINAMRVLLPDGWWGIMPGHAPMISFIDDGIVHYSINEAKRYLALYQGTIEVQKKTGEPTRVLILTAAAEEGDNLETVERNLAQQAGKLVELAKQTNLEFNQLRLSLEKSLQDSEIVNIGL